MTTDRSSQDTGRSSTIDRLRSLADRLTPTRAEDAGEEAGRQLAPAIQAFLDRASSAPSALMRVADQSEASAGPALAARLRRLVALLSDRARSRKPVLQARSERRRLDLSIQPDRVYAIGDIHGCIDKLRALEAAMIADCRGFGGTVLVVFLGDYIDRGPASAAVIDHLLGPSPPGFHKVCLCGNHEEVLVDVLEGRASTADWLRFGGDDTLLSYGFDIQYMTRQHRLKGPAMASAIRDVIPEAHIDFLRRLPAAFSTPRQIFVHAGLRPGIGLAEQSERDLLWIRDSFLNATEPGFGRLVVHGHTPTRHPYADTVRVNADTGAYQGGPLTAACLEKGTVRFLQAR